VDCLNIASSLEELDDIDIGYDAPLHRLLLIWS
jgi:hypothetical protein